MHSPRMWLHNDLVSVSIITRLRFHNMPETQNVSRPRFTSLAYTTPL